MPKILSTLRVRRKANVFSLSVGEVASWSCPWSCPGRIALSLDLSWGSRMRGRVSRTGPGQDTALRQDQTIQGGIPHHPLGQATPQAVHFLWSRWRTCCSCIFNPFIFYWCLLRMWTYFYLKQQPYSKQNIFWTRRVYHVIKVSTMRERLDFPNVFLEKAMWTWRANKTSLLPILSAVVFSSVILKKTISWKPALDLMPFF